MSASGDATPARAPRGRWMWGVIAVFALLHWDFWLWGDK